MLMDDVSYRITTNLVTQSSPSATTLHDRPGESSNITSEHPSKLRWPIHTAHHQSKLTGASGSRGGASGFRFSFDTSGCIGVATTVGTCFGASFRSCFRSCFFNRICGCICGCACACKCSCEYPCICPCILPCICSWICCCHGAVPPGAPADTILAGIGE